MKTLIRAAIAAFALAAPAYAHDGIHIEEPYLLVSSPAVKTAAGFMRIVNHSAEPDRLVSVTTDAAQAAQTHTHNMTPEGVMQMRHAEDGFPIAGHAERKLERSGDHIMLMGLTRPLRVGDTVTLALTFERGEVVEVEMPVVDQAPEGGTSEHNH